MTTTLRALQPAHFRHGEYDAFAELARGGMGTVYLARRIGAGGFERLVVLKCIHHHLLDDPSAHRLVATEARLASAIHHANVVPVVDVTDTGESLGLVLDYVESVNLSELRKARPALAPSIVSRIVCDLLSGLHAAHEARDLRGEPLEILHRDVSPQNVVVGTDGVARLIDFGISKVANAETTKDVLRGKLRYMAPEQITKKPLDRRADLFSAGVVLVELLLGRSPFGAAQDEEVALLVLLEERPDLGDLPPELTAIASRVLERSPDDRYPDAEAFRHELERACPPASHTEVAAIVRDAFGPALEARRQAVASLLRGAPGSAPGATETTPSVAKPMTGSTMRMPFVLTERRPWLVVTIAALVALTAAGAAAFFTIRRQAEVASTRLPSAPTEGSHELPPPSSAATPSPAPEPAPSSPPATVTTATTTAKTTKVRPASPATAAPSLQPSPYGPKTH